MSHSRKTLLVLVGLFAGFANAAEYQPGELIVKYKDGALRTRSTMNTLYEAAGVKSVKHYSGIMKNLEQVFLNENVKVQDAIAEFEKSSNVEYAQPNYIVHALPIEELRKKPKPRNPRNPPPGVPGAPGGGATPCIPGYDIPGCDPNAKWPCVMPGADFPPGCEDTTNPTPGNPTPPDPSNPQPPTPSQPPATRPDLQSAPIEVNPPVADPMISQAYGLDKIGATKAWDVAKGSKDMVVAVIDTGIDYNHEDLSFNVWRNPKPTQNDIAGFDFVHNDGLPFDDNEHGTHCAGSIGAVGGNGKGISGVNQRVSIMGLKFLSAEGSGTTADAVRAIDYAVTHGAKVLSNSWGGPADEGNKALLDAIERAHTAGVLFVAAAGNDGVNNDSGGDRISYPAGFTADNLIAVAATDKNDDLAFFSNFGVKTTHLAAPGVNVLSLQPGNKYQMLSGTSMACPYVAGAAALVWSTHPDWTYKQVKNALITSADKITGLNGKTVSGGRLNVFKALQASGSSME